MSRDKPRTPDEADRLLARFAAYQRAVHVGHLLEAVLATLDSIVCEARAHSIHLRGIRPHLAEASVHITRALGAAKTRAMRLDPTTKRPRKRNTRRKSRVRK